MKPAQTTEEIAREGGAGRDDQPLGDQGQDRKTWTPPAGEQGISNRPDDEPPPNSTGEEEEDADEDEDDEFDEDEESEEDDGDADGDADVEDVPGKD
jgi:hypothetical protein